MEDIITFSQNKKEYSKEEIVEEMIERGFYIDNKTANVKGFNANFFVRFILEHCFLIFAKDKFFYTYKNGVWVKLDEVQLKRYLRIILQQPRYGVWTINKEKQYFEALKLEAYYDNFLNQNKELVNMENNVFDLNDYEVYRHNYLNYFSIKIPVKYDYSANCFRFLKFISEVFEEDKERIAVAQEWLGYALTTEIKAQKALVLLGSGANGKGVFLHILSKLLGEENISNITLGELNRPFSRVCIYNKIANVCNENEIDGKNFNTGYFKAIVGGDSISAEQKGEPVFQFVPTAKMYFAMNNLPRTTDKTEGFYRRLSILSFTQHFSEETRDRDLKEKLEKELPGIFNWAIIGLRRLRNNGYNFSKCENMRQVVEEYKSEQNPIIKFFEECIEQEKNSEYKEDNRVVYQTFKNWA